MNSFEIMEAKNGGVVVVSRDFSRAPGLPFEILFAGNVKEALIYLQKKLIKEVAVPESSGWITSASEILRIPPLADDESLVCVKDGVDHLLCQITPADFGRREHSLGRPVYWAWVDGAVHLYPSPNKEYTFAVRGRPLPTNEFLQAR